jgi:hypothetical protein
MKFLMNKVLYERKKAWQKALAPSLGNIRSSDLVTSFALIDDRVDMSNRIIHHR